MDKIFYIYDWDDNILFMPTKIYLDKMVNGQWQPKKVSTSKFRDIRHHIDNWNKKIYGDSIVKYKWRFRNDKIMESIIDFRDFGHRGSSAFIIDVIKALKLNNFGPSFNSFIETIVNCRIFLICTARGHEPDTMRRAVEYIVLNSLTDVQKSKMQSKLISIYGGENLNFTLLVNKYLDDCEFIGTDSEFFKNKVGKSSDLIKPSELKTVAIEYFVKKINSKYSNNVDKIKVGFSDDTVETLHHVEKYMRDELTLKYPMDFYIIDTSNPSIEGGVKRKV